MHLERLELSNFRCFEDLKLDFHKQLTVLVGNNGVGKTAIMEAAAVAIGTLFIYMENISGRKIDKTDATLKAFPMGSTEDVQPQYPVVISATGTVDKKRVEWKRCLNGKDKNTTIKDAKFLTSISEEYQLRLQNGDTSLKLPIIAYYGTNRLWDYHRAKKADAFETTTRTNGYIDCLDGTANIKLMMNWFSKMTVKKYQKQEENLGPVPELDIVYNAMKKCFESVTGYNDVKIQYSISTNNLDVYYTDQEGLRMKMPLNQLSDGYKSTISLIADIAYRMAVLNPQLSGDVLTETDGVILIDEIDLHLHPAWQQRILEDLIDIFPKVQFIVSTHAPAVINSVKSENLLILKNNEIGGVSQQVYGKDVNSVLDEIMGVSERPKKVTELFEKFYEYLNKKEFDRADELLNQLDELRGFHDQEVAGCRVKLKLEKIRAGGKS